MAEERNIENRQIDGGWEGVGKVIGDR